MVLDGLLASQTWLLARTMALILVTSGLHAGGWHILLAGHTASNLMAPSSWPLP